MKLLHSEEKGMDYELDTVKPARVHIKRFNPLTAYIRYLFQVMTR